jgi:hypothetical protein
MKRTDTNPRSTRVYYPSDLLKASHCCLPVRGLPLQSSDGRVRWTGRLLAIAALLMAWDAKDTLRDAFAKARETVVAMYPSRRRPGGSFEGFTAAWLKRSDALVAVLTATLRAGVRKLAGRHWALGDWVVMGVDGSRFDCPRTVDNEEAFGCAGKGKTTPQQLVTVLFHVATGLLWAWRRGRGDAAERTHLREMIDLLPARTLLLADAGYTGYELLKSLQAAGHDFIVRVGANVKLLRQLGYAMKEHADTVYLWPQARQKHDLPLTLRLVRVTKQGQAAYLLTSVREKSRLTDLAVGQLYRQRWGVEVAYRSLKQTLGGRKMRSGSPRGAERELDWMLLGLWMLGSMTVRAQQGCGQPSQWSPAKALRIVRRWATRGWARPVVGGLTGQLRRAVKDGYRRRRPKEARAWPHKKKQSPPGEPKTRMARPAERLAAKALPTCQAKN